MYSGTCVHETCFALALFVPLQLSLNKSDRVVFFPSLNGLKHLNNLLSKGLRNDRVPTPQAGLAILDG